MHDDATLLQAARGGDRDAFGALVLRYQGLVSGLTFHATGDLIASEDLAQQTFVTAWTRLSELREPERLKAWLAGIARNLARHHHRDGQRRRDDPTEPGAMQQMLASHEPSPLDLATREEQARQVWATLAEVPEPYREALVLYYRGERSLADLAAATGISLDAAKQRLHRGRRMLREEMARRIEDSLVQSRPDQRFSASILASLPATGAGATAGGGGLAAILAKLPLLGPWLLGPLLGIAGGVFGSWCSLRSARSDAERRELWRMIRLSLAVVVGHLALLLGIQFGVEDPTLRWLLVLATWLAWAVVLVVMVTRGNRRLREIRAREEAATAPAAGSPAATKPATGPVTTRALRVNILGAMLGSSLWLVLCAAMAGDTLGTSLCLSALTLLCVQRWHAASSATTAVAQLRFNANSTLLSTGLAFVAVLWRWDHWAVASLPAAPWPRWQVLAVLALIGGVVGGTLHRRARRLAETAPAGGAGIEDP